LDKDKQNVVRISNAMGMKVPIIYFDDSAQYLLIGTLDLRQKYEKLPIFLLTRLKTNQKNDNWPFNEIIVTSF
jgi:hypothetical protein